MSIAPNPLDFYDVEGRLDSVGWTNALIAHARAQHEPDEADDLADEVQVLGDMNAQLGAENLRLLTENARLRAIVAADVSRPGGRPESNHTARERIRRTTRQRIAGHFESKRARHR